jgi:primosomal protein N''
MLDFDEILVNIKNPQIKKYVSESISSYRVSNYRSAIIAIWIAAMFDLVKKFEILTEQREPSATKKWKELKPKIEDHKNWEQELVDAAKAVAMISSYEAETLKELSKKRNLYAHPSFDEVGTLFDPTPEEVRYFIRSLYDIVLSQPAQLGAFYVNQLLEQIKGPTYFSEQLIIYKLNLQKPTVINIIKKVNPKQLPRITKELFKVIASPQNESHELNALCFLMNIWDAQHKLEILQFVSIAKSWDEYLESEPLKINFLEALLNYPERINDLSKNSQQIIEKSLKNNCEKLEYLLETLANLFSCLDTVPLAQSCKKDISNYISTSRVIQEVNYSLNALDDNLSNIFGQLILEETRDALRTKKWLSGES